jgi:hypothetical protein
VFDFAINFLSALLRAVKEQAYLLKTTAAAAAGFGLLLLALPPRPDDVSLMGTFIAAQAAWAVLLLIRVVSRWPRAVGKPHPAAPRSRFTGYALELTGVPKVLHTRGTYNETLPVRHRPAALSAAGTRAGPFA